MLFLNYALSTLVATGSAVAILAFLSKKILEHRLQKDISDYKASLDIKYKKLLESNIFAFKEEMKYLDELWSLIIVICKICGSYSKEEPTSQLADAVAKLDNYLLTKEPYIHKSVYDIATQLSNKADPEIYKSENYKEIQTLKKKLVTSYRDRIYLSEGSQNA